MQIFKRSSMTDYLKKLIVHYFRLSISQLADLLSSFVQLAFLCIVHLAWNLMKVF